MDYAANDVTTENSKGKQVMINTANTVPWYKEKWVWLIIAIPGMSVFLGIIMITVAVSGRDSLVKDDYYKEGRMINLELKKDQLANHLGLSASMTISKRNISVVLQGEERFEQPSMVRLQFIHPTLADTDLDFMLIKNGSEYAGELPELATGRRYIHLTDHPSSWRLKGEAWLPAADHILLQPSVPENE